MDIEGLKNLDLNVNISVAASGGPENDGETRIFTGRINYEAGVESVVIRVNEADNKNLLKLNKPIFLFLAHDLGLYILSANISKKGIVEDKTIIHCSRLRQVKAYQRRKSVRVNVNIPTSFNLENDRGNINYGFVTDISVGGLQLWSPLSFAFNTDFEMMFQLDSDKPVFVTGKVVRNTEHDGKILLGIKYNNPDTQTQDDIARFVIAEQMRQKRLGLQIFKAFIFNAHLKVVAPSIFTITRYKNLDISALLDKKCEGIITEVGIHGISMECPLKLPVGAELEFSVELPQIGYSVIRAVVKELVWSAGKNIINVEFTNEYEKIRDVILAQMSRGFELN